MAFILKCVYPNQTLNCIDFDEPCNVITIDNDVEIRGQSCTHGPMRGNGQCPVKNIEEYPPANMAWGR
ncbi:Sodium-dependent organic anion transporter [Trichinella pseudospiralis]